MRTLTYSLLLCLLSTNAFAQGERATVTGTVSDASGAIVPAVAISIRNLETNATSRTSTNSAGLFYIPALSPGAYDINAEKAGFRPSRVLNLRLTVGLTATVAITLEVGTVTQALEVSASSVQLEAQTSGLGKVVEQRRVVELPLLGRNPLALAATAPGVLPTSGQRGTGQDIIGVSTTSQINGGLA